MRATGYEPVPAREAFEINSADARMSQAAFLLSVGAGVADDTEQVPHSEQFPMPPLEPMAHPAPIPLAQAAEKLDVPTQSYLGGWEEEIPQDECARLARDLYDDPEPDTAASLVEAALHNRYRLVRTAAATAALDTTGAREDVIATLEESARSRDPDVRELARTALGRAQPENPFLDRYVVRRKPVHRRPEPSNTAVVSHGTWAARQTWWRPGGTFYEYLDDLAPPLDLHEESYRWSGAYSHAARDLAAEDLVDWVAAQQLDRPDYFAHSHGATVANLATQKGLELERLVLMGWPVHQQWLFDLDQVEAVLDVRVRFDLVILADRGGQRLPRAVRSHPKVTEEINGWFSHASTHEPSYWDRHQLPSTLAGIP